MGYEFFDTNALIFLLDQFTQNGTKTASFLKDKNILISNRVLSEIRVSHSRNTELKELLSIADIYITDPDLLYFRELDNFGRGRSVKDWFSPVELDEWTIDFVASADTQKIFGSDINIKKTVYSKYSNKFESAIGTMPDERRLRASIDLKVLQGARENGVMLGLEDIRYRLFPSQFITDYVWYYKYARQVTAKVTENDMYDVLNAILAPYVTKWIGERALIGILKQIKGHTFATSFSALKYLYLKGELEEEAFNKFKNIKNKLVTKEVGLENTELITMSDLNKIYDNFKMNK